MGKRRQLSVKKQRQIIEAIRCEMTQTEPQKPNLATFLTSLGFFAGLFHVLNGLEFLDDNNKSAIFVTGGTALYIANHAAQTVVQKLTQSTFALKLQARFFTTKTNYDLGMMYFYQENYDAALTFLSQVTETPYHEHYKQKNYEEAQLCIGIIYHKKAQALKGADVETLQNKKELLLKARYNFTRKHAFQRMKTVDKELYEINTQIKRITSTNFHSQCLMR